MAMMSWPPVCCKMNERKMGGRGEKGKGRQGRADGKSRKVKEMGKPGKTRMKLSKTAERWADCCSQVEMFCRLTFKPFSI